MDRPIIWTNVKRHHSRHPDGSPRLRYVEFKASRQLDELPPIDWLTVEVYPDFKTDGYRNIVRPSGAYEVQRRVDRVQAYCDVAIATDPLTLETTLATFEHPPLGTDAWRRYNDLAQHAASIVLATTFARFQRVM